MIAGKPPEDKKAMLNCIHDGLAAARVVIFQRI